MSVLLCFKVEMTMASPATLRFAHIHIPLHLTHFVSVFVFACSISHLLRHANTLVLVHTHVCILAAPACLHFAF